MGTLIDSTIAFAKTTLTTAEGGHDWFHTQRVYNNAATIGRAEGNVDMIVVQLGALLHDIADSKFHDGDEEVGPRTAREWLESQGADPALIEHVVNIVRHISFKGGLEGQQWTSPELAVVQDADRLDALGAIGIARTFNYGGHKGRLLYDPDVPPNPNMTKAEYKASTAPTLNHFPEKLFLLKGLMNTKTGRAMAEERDAFLHEFFDRFLAEWNGEL
jgi:uncharacterized protein